MMPPPPPVAVKPPNESELGMFEIGSNGSNENDPLINFYKGSAQANVESWNLGQDQEPQFPEETLNYDSATK